MCKREIPRGCAVVRIEDLRALLGVQPSPVTAAAELPGSAWDGLAIAVAMVTAALGRHDVDLGQLADGADPAAIIRVLVPMAAAGLRHCLTDDSAGQFLRDLGEIAVMRGRAPDGRHP